MSRTLESISCSTYLLIDVYVVEEQKTCVIYKFVSVLVMTGAGQGNAHK